MTLGGRSIVNQDGKRDRPKGGWHHGNAHPGSQFLLSPGDQFVVSLTPPPEGPLSKPLLLQPKRGAVPAQGRSLPLTGPDPERPPSESEPVAVGASIAVTHIGPIGFIGPLPSHSPRTTRQMAMVSGWSS